MDYTQVDSSNVFGVGYEIATATLLVDFTNGSRYVYAGVPPGVFADLVSAESVGKFLAKEIKGKYDYERIR